MAVLLNLPFLSLVLIRIEPHQRKDGDAKNQKTRLKRLNDRSTAFH